MLKHSLVPEEISKLYECHDWHNGLAVLATAHSEEWREILGVLEGFRLLQSDIVRPGGRKSPIASKIDGNFFQQGWKEKAFDTRIRVDDSEYRAPTHSVDCFKNRIAIEVEWNNKDPFYDRDLNNFRLLFDLRAIDVGIIITRCDDLQDIFNELGKGKSYGASTTHMSKLLPRIHGGGGGGCPLVVFGISKACYVED